MAIGYCHHAVSGQDGIVVFGGWNAICYLRWLDGTDSGGPRSKATA